MGKLKYVLLIATVWMGVTSSEDIEAVKGCSSGYNRFTSEIYKEVQATKSGNFLVCPLSLDIILALVTQGAKANTHHELATTLHLPDKPETVNKIFHTLQDNLKNNNLYTLTSANKVFIKEGYKIRPGFKNIAVNTFGSDIENINFGNKEQAAEEINKWVEEKTFRKIKDLIKPIDLNERTRSVLVNALYFQGNWVKMFKEYQTRKRAFKTSSSHQIDTDMMAQKGRFNYYESVKLNAKFLEMPYQGGDVSLHIVLPNNHDGLDALSNELIDVMSPPPYEADFVDVIIPKFKIETETRFKPILQKMGIIDAFEDHANFSGIIENTDLKITQVIQKTFINVHETGTTAAAATGVLLAEPISAPIFPKNMKQFHADHPFMFYLRLTKLGINFFVGRYTSP